MTGSKPAGSATPHQPKVSVRPQRERASAAAMRRHEPLRPDPPDPGHGQLAGARAGGDSRRGRQDERRDGVRPAHGGAQADEAAERVADPGRGQGVLALEDGKDGVGVGVERRRLGKRPGAAVAGQLGHDHAPVGRQRRRDPQPVRGRATEAVDEHDRRAGRAPPTR